MSAVLIQNKVTQRDIYRASKDYGDYIKKEGLVYEDKKFGLCQFFYGFKENILLDMSRKE